MTNTKQGEEWEKELSLELDLLLGEYASTGDDERKVNILELFDKSRKEVVEEIEIWSEAQAQRWESDAMKEFASGIVSGYRWLIDHLPHIGKTKKCRCPVDEDILDSLKGK